MPSSRRAGRGYARSRRGARLGALMTFPLDATCAYLHLAEPEPLPQINNLKRVWHLTHGKFLWFEPNKSVNGLIDTRTLRDDVEYWKIPDRDAAMLDAEWPSNELPKLTVPQYQHLVFTIRRWLSYGPIGVHVPYLATAAARAVRKTFLQSLIATGCIDYLYMGIDIHTGEFTNASDVLTPWVNYALSIAAGKVQVMVNSMPYTNQGTMRDPGNLRNELITAKQLGALIGLFSPGRSAQQIQPQLQALMEAQAA